MPAKKTKIKKTPASPVESAGIRTKGKEKMLSIWFFVGLMLTVIGVIVTGTGINYIFHPQNATRLAELNPNLWWGVIILVAGFLFLVPAWKQHNKQS